MQVFTVTNTKKFMAMLLKENVFDLFELRNITITTFSTFEIDGRLNKDYFENKDDIKGDFCKWKDVKPFAFEIIKGNRLPKFIKLVLSADNETVSKISPQASALFINITFENNEITIITGSSTKTFTMDKRIDFMWDEYVEEFFINSKTPVSTQAY